MKMHFTKSDYVKLVFMAMIYVFFVSCSKDISDHPFKYLKKVSAGGTADCSHSSKSISEAFPYDNTSNGGIKQGATIESTIYIQLLDTTPSELCGTGASQGHGKIVASANVFWQKAQECDNYGGYLKWEGLALATNTIEIKHLTGIQQQISEIGVDKLVFTAKQVTLDADGNISATKNLGMHVHITAGTEWTFELDTKPDPGSLVRIFADSNEWKDKFDPASVGMNIDFELTGVRDYTCP